MKKPPGHEQTGPSVQPYINTSGRLASIVQRVWVGFPQVLLVAEAEQAGPGGEVGGDVRGDDPAAVDLPGLGGRFRRPMALAVRTPPVSTTAERGAQRIPFHWLPGWPRGSRYALFKRLAGGRHRLRRVRMYLSGPVRRCTGSRPTDRTSRPGAMVCRFSLCRGLHRAVLLVFTKILPYLAHMGRCQGGESRFPLGGTFTCQRLRGSVARVV
jgi:hypothetical protein